MKQRQLTPAVRELAMAWARGDVTLRGVMKQLNLNEFQYPTAYSILARALRKHIQINKL